MRNQLKALRRKIPVKPQIPELRDAFNLYLFTSAEQERIQAFIEQIEPRVHHSKHGTPLLNELTLEETDQLESWVRLYNALDSEDIATAARCRRYLELDCEDKEQVYSAFMSIDESRFPVVSHCTDAPSVKWDGTTHYIYRGGYQWQKQHMRQHKAHSGYLRRWEIDGMWLWLEQASLLVH